MALLIKLNRPFGVVRINAGVDRCDFGRKGEIAVEVPDKIADQLSGITVPQYRRIYLPAVAPVAVAPVAVAEPTDAPVAIEYKYRIVKWDHEEDLETGEKKKVQAVLFESNDLPETEEALEVYKSDGIKAWIVGKKPSTSEE